jgi:hypothetical protein
MPLPRAQKVAGVCLAMKPVGKPDAGNLHVRFDERGGETAHAYTRHRAPPRLYELTILTNAAPASRRQDSTFKAISASSSITSTGQRPAYLCVRSVAPGNLVVPDVAVCNARRWSCRSPSRSRLSAQHDIPIWCLRRPLFGRDSSLARRFQMGVGSLRGAHAPLSSTTTASALPSAPSRPIPVSSTPTASPAHSRHTLCKNTSTEGR